jgi:hypothetical protein
MPSPSQLRSNPFVKFASAASQPLRKVFSDDGSIKSTRTATGTENSTQEAAEKCLVRFSEKKLVRKTLSREDYTNDETKAAWWSFEESRQIARQRRKEINRIERGEKFKDKKFCARGLEGRTKTRSVSTAQRRELAINAVLDEQLSQWVDGVCDEQSIADIYYIVSSGCQLWASLVGRRDNRAAKEIHEQSSYTGQQSSTAPHHHDHDHEQATRKCSSNDGLKQSSVVPRAA